ncbi:hypothetical protein WT08_03935 [Burkholderia sp. MSMB1552]|nr:hypothetical protein WT08_03935 [Burkholderia sp. MSMB1552]KWZ51016.1 hypothetical protein WS92_27245 [Burkholderia sp. MSMB1588]
MQRLRRVAASEAGRLLRVLLVRIGVLPVEAEAIGIGRRGRFVTTNDGRAASRCADAWMYR